MGRFVFKLDPVLRQRQRTEEQHRRTLAQLLRRRSDMHEQLRTMQTGLSSDKRQMAESLTGQVDVDRIRRHASHNAQVIQRAHGIVQHLAELGQQVEQARAALIEASQYRKAIELLRDRQHRRWKRKTARREAAAADELATQRYGRGGEEGLR